ncbi:MAG TPA: C25 family cysteine peptidase [Bacteroidales bacterium]|nr:C25 family cysteine peptidase [Bacteroidales bacterium]
MEDDTVLHLPSGKIPLAPIPPPVITGADSRPPVFIPDLTTYLRDAWFPDSACVTIANQGTLNGEPIGLLTIRPVYYNPVQGTLHIIRKIRIQPEEGFASEEWMTPLPIAGMLKHKLLYLGPSLKDTMTRMPISYVILADTMFRQVLQPFIQWKKQTGYHVIEVYKGEDGVGNTPETMREKLREIFLNSSPENPPPTYLLICGDHEVIPAFYGKTSGHLTDLYYAEYDGNNDYLPEVYYGRMSARTPEQLKNQLDKTMEYEKCLLPSLDYLDTAMLIAGVDYTYAPTYGNGQINYASVNYFNTASGVNTHVFLHPESGSRRDSILNLLNRGVGFVNYTGHGEDDRWMNPYISTTDLDSLKNWHKYPIVVTNGCRTNAFGYEECFGEALLRPAGRGAVGHIGGTNDTYWDEDYYWAVGVGAITTHPEFENTSSGAFDRLFHTHGEEISEWYTTLGQIIFAGNLAVMESGSSRTRYYWEVYHLLGDPSLMPYLHKPESQICICPEFLPEGISSLTIPAEPEAYVSLNLNGEPLDAAVTGKQGLASFSFNPLQAGDTVFLFVSRQNRKPFLAGIPVISLSGAYVIHAGDTLNEVQAISENHRAERGEVLTMGILLKNIGKTEASDLKLTLHSNDSLLMVTDSVLFINSILAGQEFFSDTGFQIRFADIVPDQHLVLMQLIASGSSGAWTSLFPLTLNAPKPVIRRILYDDSLLGNGNHSPDPGEHFFLKILLTNAGNSSMTSWPFTIDSPNTGITYSHQTITVQSLLPGDSVILTTVGQVSRNLSGGDTVRFHVLSGVDGYPAEKTCILFTGSVNDDYESGALNHLPYTMDGDASWISDTWMPFAGNYSARSGLTGDLQSSVLQIRVFYPENGMIAFAYRVSSESGYDFFDFLIDDDKFLRKSGTIPWTNASWPVSQGWHTFTWKYSKDNNTSRGKDAAWIDNLLLVPAITDTTTNICLSEILTPAKDSSWGELVRPVVRILNRSQVTISNPKVFVSVNNHEPVMAETDQELLPGNYYDFQFPQPIELGTTDDYLLTAWVSCPLDAFPIDDTARVTFRRTGVASPADTTPFTLWPVPTTELLYISTTGLKERLNFHIISMTGRTLLEGFIPENCVSCPIYVGNLKEGIYLLRLTNLQGKALKKKYFVVQR